MAKADAAPRGKLDGRFSDPRADARAWGDVARVLEEAELYWLTTIRRDGRPHVTPLIGMWLDDAFQFCTGADEQKAKNVEANPQCAVTTGCNSWDSGFDAVVEGKAVRVREQQGLQRLADAYLAKYGDAWKFGVGDGVLTNSEGGDALVFAVRPAKVLGFGKEPHSQTTWRF
jgi:general stress protein 26